MTRDLLAMLGFLAFIGGMVLLSAVALYVHRNCQRGRLWAILETIRSYLADECK
jgi:hypothetical protein